MKYSLYILIGLGIFIIAYYLSNDTKYNLESTKPEITPTPVIHTQAKEASAYTIIMVGDSMTEALGKNSDKLRANLNVYYPNKVFGIFNLGAGSTNIMSVQDLLDKDILPNREFEVILIESFGHNPLSQYPLEVGLKKQTEVLDRIVKSIRSAKANSEIHTVIIFVATIAPNRDKYAQGQVDLTLEKRQQWADERTAYIKNHIDYAKQHNIPLINIFEKSLNQDGTGNLEYIDSISYIHPSSKGIELISKEIADYLYTNQILPP